MAPELFNNEGYNQKADIFSVGVILYFLLTGTPVFRALTSEELKWLNK